MLGVEFLGDELHELIEREKEAERLGMKKELANSGKKKLSELPLKLVLINPVDVQNISQVDRQILF